MLNSQSKNRGRTAENKIRFNSQSKDRGRTAENKTRFNASEKVSAFYTFYY